MQWFGAKDKTRPTKADLIRAVDQHFNGCHCEATTHTIQERANRYIYTITRSVDTSKAQS
jgi:hypothetical protein